MEALLSYDPDSIEMLAQGEKYAAVQKKLLADRIELVTTARGESRGVPPPTTSFSASS